MGEKRGKLFWLLVIIFFPAVFIFYIKNRWPVWRRKARRLTSKRLWWHTQLWVAKNHRSRIEIQLGTWYDPDRGVRGDAPRGMLRTRLIRQMQAEWERADDRVKSLEKKLQN